MTERRFHEEYPVTSYLILINIGFFGLELIQHLKVAGGIPAPLSLSAIDHSATDMLGSLSMKRVAEGQWWRVVSAGFLHGGFLHILFNGMMLLDLGRHCEPFLSPWKFLVAYLIALLGGSAGSLIQSAMLDAPGRSSVGASGALCGLIGLLLAHSIRERDWDQRDAIVRDIGGIIVLSLFYPAVDHAAHAGGFLAGGIFGFSVGPYISSREADRWRLPGRIAGGAGLACLAWAVAYYFIHR